MLAISFIHCQSEGELTDCATETPAMVTDSRRATHTVFTRFFFASSANQRVTLPADEPPSEDCG